MDTNGAFRLPTNEIKREKLQVAYKSDSLFEKLQLKEASMAIVGLGYVGLPLALHMASKYRVVGFDINSNKIFKLLDHIDPSNELSEVDFIGKDIRFSFKENDLSQSKFYIIAVPTPIDKYKKPNLEPLKAATAMVADNLKKGDCVVFESTVFPGCTEEVCVPILERISRLKLDKDFSVGYSPERINPGDKNHTFTKIKKIVSGSNDIALDLITNIYESVVEAGVHRAENIKVAEAAKVVENIQRDVNIGLMNELSQVFNALNINTDAVLKAAGSKWNFHNYFPGLVGGHCIGVDPYYLIDRAKKFNVRTQLLEQVRKTNEGMVEYIVNTIIKNVWPNHLKTKWKVLIKGITFKENVSDIRNSKVIDIIKQLKKHDFDVVVEDPCANALEVMRYYNLPLLNEVTKDDGKFDVIVMAVNHNQFHEIKELDSMLTQRGFLFDIRGTFKHLVSNKKYLTL